MSALVARGVGAHLSKLEELHVFPTAATKVMAVARSASSSLDDMEQAVSLDPVLAGRVLKLANSPLYARQTRIASVGRAVQALGFSGTRDVALALAIGGVGSDRSPWGRRAWLQAVATAWAAKSLARNVRQVDVEAAFVMGLLHNVGLQLLVVLHEKETNAMLDAAGSIAALDPDVERGVFGTDHIELGAAALRRWSLPDALCDAVAHQREGLFRIGAARPRDLALLKVSVALAGAAAEHREVSATVAAGYAHPSASVLRAVRGAYVATAELLVENWDELAAF